MPLERSASIRGLRHQGRAFRELGLCGLDSRGVRRLAVGLVLRLFGGRLSGELGAALAVCVLAFSLICLSLRDDPLRFGLPSVLGGSLSRLLGALISEGVVLALLKRSMSA
jgi:hypothetical protein